MGMLPLIECVGTPKVRERLLRYRLLVISGFAYKRAVANARVSDMEGSL